MKKSYLLLLLFSFLFHGNAISANISWTGNGGSPIWGNPANWSCGCLPGPGDDVTIGDGSQYIYVDFSEYNVSVNSLLLQNAELELQLDLTVLDYAEIDPQSTITFSYFSSEVYTILTVENLYFYGTANVHYNNIPAEGGSLFVFDFSEIVTDCDNLSEGLGYGSGFTVVQGLYCDSYEDDGTFYYDFGPLEIYEIEYEANAIVWTGNSDFFWNNPNNWSPIGIPTASNVVLLGESAEVVANQSINVDEMLVGVDCTLEINAGFSSKYYTWIDETASITWKGGNLSRSDVNQQNIIFNYGEFNIETAAAKSMNNGLKLDNFKPSQFTIGEINIKENAVVITDGNSNSLRNYGGNINIEGDNQNVFFDEIINYGTIEKASGTGESILKASSFINYDDVKSSIGVFKIGNGFDNQGRLSGNGSFDFEFANGTPETLSGGITPGNSPGLLTFVSCPELKNASLVIEINGTNPGTQYDQLNVLDDVVIDGGILNVFLPNWYTPEDGDQFNFMTTTGSITGAFNSFYSNYMINNWTVTYNSQGVKVTFGTVVPIELVDISVQEESLGNLLKWTTASEINSQDFIIELSDNYSAWQEVGKVNCKGSETNGSAYSFLHRNTENSVSYYRLKMRDLDGSYEYSKIVSVNRTGRDQEIVVYPNPVSNFISLNNVNSIKEVQIYGIDGKLLKNFEDIDSQMDISELLPGLYLISIKDADGILFNSKFIKK